MEPEKRGKGDKPEQTHVRVLAPGELKLSVISVQFDLKVRTVSIKSNESKRLEVSNFARPICCLWLIFAPTSHSFPPKSTCKAPSVNFTIILWASFVLVDLSWTYWHTAKSIQTKSWAYLLVVCTGKVRRNFVGETQWRKRMTASPFALCVIRLVKLTPARVLGWVFAYFPPPTHLVEVWLPLFLALLAAVVCISSAEVNFSLKFNIRLFTQCCSPCNFYWRF